MVIHETIHAKPIKTQLVQSSHQVTAASFITLNGLEFRPFISVHSIHRYTLLFTSNIIPIHSSRYRQGLHHYWISPDPLYSFTHGQDVLWFKITCETVPAAEDVATSGRKVPDQCLYLGLYLAW